MIGAAPEDEAGFDRLHHPVHQRLRELVTSGELGAPRRVEIVLAIPAPADSDPRWSWELAGGATMDLGCYTYQLAHLAGTLREGTPFLIDMDDSVSNAELIDACYRRAGLSPRGI